MDTDAALGLGLGLTLLLVWLMFVVGMLILIGTIAWKITAKTGYPGPLGLLYFVPLANLVFLIVLAFSEWPIHRELKALKGSSEPRPPGL
jgi:hypothetical protein